eukprot:1138478-Pelagomonas_calceolata.AAC.6
MHGHLCAADAGLGLPGEPACDAEPVAQPAAECVEGACVCAPARDAEPVVQPAECVEACRMPMCAAMCPA